MIAANEDYIRLIPLLVTDIALCHYLFDAQLSFDFGFRLNLVLLLLLLLSQNELVLGLCVNKKYFLFNKKERISIHFMKY